MTDHRVTDLSYGHLGKAIYDIEGKEWNFSLDTDQGSSFSSLVKSKLTRFRMSYPAIGKLERMHSSFMSG